MSEARTIWHDLEARRSESIVRKHSGVLLAIALLSVMTVCEVAFLRYFAGPASVNLMVAAECVPVGGE